MREHKNCYQCGGIFYRKKENNGAWFCRTTCGRRCKENAYSERRKISRLIEQQREIMEYRNVIKLFNWTNPIDRWLYTVRTDSVGTIWL